MLAELRTADVRTAIVTNNVKALGGWRDLADWDALADALFLDDMQANVDGAIDAGLTGVLVTESTAAIGTVRRLVAAGRSGAI